MQDNIFSSFWSGEGKHSLLFVSGEVNFHAGILLMIKISGEIVTT